MDAARFAAEAIDELTRQMVHDDVQWLRGNRRGRWFVLEPGPSRYLTDSSKRVKQYVDAVCKRRARRFSSLSRARAFARHVGGSVHRWRRVSPSGQPWQYQTPWERATESMQAQTTVLHWMASRSER